MVIDTSALISVLLKENNHNSILEALEKHTSFISTATLHETFMVSYQRKGMPGWQIIETLLSKSLTEIISLDESIARLSMQAYTHFGKGQGSKAKLNFGDCFSYATALALNQPLLFVGNDFKHTDIESVL